MKENERIAFTVKTTVGGQSAGVIIIPKDRNCTECIVEFNTNCKVPTVIRKTENVWQVVDMGAVTLNPADVQVLGEAIDTFLRDGYCKK